MDITKKGNKIIVTRILKRNETYRINKSEKFESLTFMKKPQLVRGMASATEDNHDVLFIDYDTPCIEVVEQDYYIIQKKFSLPQAYLFKTTKGFHVVVLKKFLPRMIYTILSHTHCDSAYISMPLRNKYRNWILRISPKKRSKRPKFIGLIGEKRKYTGVISKAHKDFLTRIYPKIKHPIYSIIDKSNKISIQEYEASN